MKRTLKRITWGVLAAAAATMLVLAFLPSPIGVTAVTVRRSTLSLELAADGRTRVRDRYVVSAPVSGRLLRIDRREGDRVRAGERVATIAPTEQTPQQRAELARRIDAATEGRNGAADIAARLESAHSLALREASRVRQMQDVGAASRQELDRAESTVDAAWKEHAAALHRVEAANAEIAALRAARASGESASESERLQLRSPIVGRVLGVHDPSARTVVAGAPLMTIGEPTAIEIVLDLLSSDAVKVVPGQRVIIEGWGGDRELDARVESVEPSGFTKVSALGIEEQRVNVIATLRESAPGLGDGYRVDARVVIWRGEALTAPTSALFRVGADWTVFVVRDGRAHRQVVRVGRRSMFEAEVLSGLEPGDIVVTHPSDLLEDGARVELQEVE
jgi:HlyD family secretion protein